MRLRFLSLVLFALLSGPLVWVSQARVPTLEGSIASVAQLPGARFVRWVDARGLSLGERERVESYLARRYGLLGSLNPTGFSSKYRDEETETVYFGYRHGNQGHI